MTVDLKKYFAIFRLLLLHMFAHQIIDGDYQQFFLSLPIETLTHLGNMYNLTKLASFANWVLGVARTPKLGRSLE